MTNNETDPPLSDGDLCRRLRNFAGGQPGYPGTGGGGRLSATGVMTCMPAWPDEAQALKALDRRVAVGLHLPP